MSKKGERSKGNHISERAAALVARTENEVPAVKDAIRKAYDLRNDIVHGDCQSPNADLKHRAEQLRVWGRQVLVASLRLGGDQGKLEASANDATGRDKNRALVPRYNT